ncbi:outer membrane protein assembly factor BamA [Enterobacteriaceae endosymbiont of Donacia thalassina]|uniref:outer membrane protein assembly factor BamA n=1 Tax=Enterobacteriaceae endosymbiont of Donacia thalassina TaxID=2675786 RepID=UPI001449D82D|nr:outer membrane protein assembly factor BamA [Enterobacteriaceae endosymbiont of Donacia thalassina]QJC37337.1 outer membrane protein assembly factor BamA [Enterobacteriaceae endosymbiont of Donacia thalassina]
MILNSFKKKYFLKNIKYYKYILVFLLIFNTHHMCCAAILKKKKYCIKNIIFFGLNKIKIKDIKIYSYINTKNCISLKEISNLMHLLFITNMVNNINVFQNKNFIFIKVMEKPIINNIIIKGNKIIDNNFINFLLNQLQIKKGKILNNNVLFFFRKNIELLFLKYSMLSSYITIKIKKNINNKIDILIIFKEDNFTKINKIDIIGNNFYTTKFLLNYLKINNNFLFIFSKKKKYKINFIIKILNKLKNFYINNGYVKFQIKNIIQNLSYDKKNIYLIIKIKENKKFFYNKIIIDIDKKKYFQYIKNIINIIPGKIYQNSKIIELKYKIKNFLGKNGFLTPQILIKNILDEKNNKIDIIFKIKTNHKYYVRKINFLGNHFTQDYILRNELLQIEGNPINIELIKKTQERLYSLGYFNKVEIFLHKNNDLNNTVDIIYQVDEKNEGSLKSGLGMIKGGLLGFNTILKQNNFIGTGYDIDINFNKDFYHSYLEFFIMKNHIFFKKINAGIKIFLNTINEDDNFFYNYINKNKGFFGILKFPINDNSILTNSIGFIQNNISNIEPQLSLWNYLRYIGYKIYNKLHNNYVLDEFIINYTFLYSNLKNFNIPSDGILSSINTYFSIPWYSKNRNYKINFNYSRYIPLQFKIFKNLFKNNPLIFLFKSNFGYGNGFLGGKYPFYKNFYLGGSNTIRGFQTNSIGPKGVYFSSKKYHCNNGKTICLSNNAIGGNVLFNINNELIMPISFLDSKYINQIRSSIFLDIGNLIDTSWKNNYLFKLYKIPNFNIFSQIRSSIGLSFQFHTPFGDITISFAYPFQTYQTDKIQFFQFNFSKRW